MSLRANATIAKSIIHSIIFSTIEVVSLFIIVKAPLNKAIVVPIKAMNSSARGRKIRKL